MFIKVWVSKFSPEKNREIELVVCMYVSNVSMYLFIKRYLKELAHTILRLASTKSVE